MEGGDLPHLISQGFFLPEIERFLISVLEKSALSKSATASGIFKHFSGSNGQFWDSDWLSVRNFKHFVIGIVWRIFLISVGFFCFFESLQSSVEFFDFRFQLLYVFGQAFNFLLSLQEQKFFWKCLWRFLLHFCNLLESTNLINPLTAA